MNIEQYKNTYHNSWTKGLSITIIDENEEWLLIERLHPDMEYLQRILINKNENIYITWQDINLNVWINYIDKRKDKWICQRCFEYDERNVKDLINLLRVSIL